MHDTQLDEARQVHAKSHKLIETLAGGGIPERVTVVAMQQVLIERMLATSGVVGTQRWLLDQAKRLDEWGPAFIAAASSQR